MKIFITNIFLLLLIAACSGSEDTTQHSNDDSETDQLYNAKEKALDHFINGSIAESNEDFALAIVEFTEALNYDTSSGIFYALAKNYLALEKLASALKYANFSIAYDSTELDYYDLLAEIFIQAHEVDSAALVLEKIIDINPGRINTYYQLARIYEDSKPLKAIGIYEDLTKLIGSDWNVLIHIAELYEKLGYKEEAAIALQKLLAIAPKYNLTSQSDVSLSIDSNKSFANGRIAESVIAFAKYDAPILILISNGTSGCPKINPYSTAAACQSSIKINVCAFFSRISRSSGISSIISSNISNASSYFSTRW